MGKKGIPPSLDCDKNFQKLGLMRLSAKKVSLPLFRIFSLVFFIDR